MNKLFFFVPSLSMLAAVACGSTAPLEDRPCPCATGWTCCESQNVCVADVAACAGRTGDGGTSGDSAAPYEYGPVKLAEAQSALCITTDDERVFWQNANGLVVGASKTGGPIQISHFQTPLARNDVCAIVVFNGEVITTAYDLGKVLRLHIMEGDKDTTDRPNGSSATKETFQETSRSLVLSSSTTTPSS